VAYSFQHLVIVHGIGDEQKNETVINFMNEFVRAMPEAVRDTVDIHNLVEQPDPKKGGLLLRSGPPDGRPAYLLLRDQGKPYVIAFSEVYWKPVTNGYIERHKQPPIPIFPWAHSINLRLFKGGKSYRTGREAIENLETMLGLVKRLALIYKKSGMLSTVLEQFLGDVEMYVESEPLRQNINDVFFEILGNDGAVAAEVLSQVKRRSGTPDQAQGWAGIAENETWASHEVFVIAHSEGTVVSYNSLVKAAVEREKDSTKCEWLPRVRGLVTLGSPLDKHYSIWRSRFVTNALSRPPVHRKIRWFNYWDRSDPVGYGLSELRPGDPASDAGKMFAVEYDRGYARYPIPGKAHVDYWTDADIHRDILQKMLRIGGPRPQVVGSKWWGREWIMASLERVAYAVGRAVTLVAMLYFLTRILEPLRQKVGGLRDWAAHTWGSSAADPTPRGWVSWAVTIAWVAVPIVILKVWSDLEETEDAHTGAGKAARAILFGGWLILLALVLPDFKRAPGQYCCAQVGIKDYVGYAMGLLVAASVWQLHTTVHKGIVQMWRYTGGQGTGAAEAPAPGEGA
jgi:hypothetical protein